MGHSAARLFKQFTQLVMRGKSERMVRAEQPTTAPVLSSATDVTGRRSARVLSLVLTLEALRAAPDVFDSPAAR